MYAGILTTPCSGTVVWLHSLKDARRNGQIALIAGAATVGRCAVQLLTDNSIISIRLCNLSLSSSFFCIKEAAGTGGLGVYATQDIEAGVQPRFAQSSVTLSLTVSVLVTVCACNRLGVVQLMLDACCGP